MDLQPNPSTENLNRPTLSTTTKPTPPIANKPRHDKLANPSRPRDHTLGIPRAELSPPVKQLQARAKESTTGNYCTPPLQRHTRR